MDTVVPLYPVRASVNISLARLKSTIKRSAYILNQSLMTEIGGYEFEGPYKDAEPLQMRPGTYVVVDIVDGEPQSVLDIGTSSQIEERLGGHHSRQDCWHRHKDGEIGYFVKYTGGSTDVDPYNYAPPAVRKSNEDTRKERLIIEDELFWKYDVPCGTNHWEQKEKMIERYNMYEKMFGPRAQHEL
jgi:hypothetical protein